MMAEQERKTVTLAAGDDIIHKGYKNGKVFVGKIVGKVYKEEKDRANDGTALEQKAYSASFRIAGNEKDPGLRVRVRSTQPIDLSASVFWSLLKKGRTSVKGMWSEKKGSTYDAVVVLDDTGEKYVRFKLEFPKRKEGVNGKK